MNAMNARTFDRYVTRTQEAMQRVADQFEVGELEFGDHLRFFLAEHVSITGDPEPKVEPLPEKAAELLKSLLKTGPSIIDAAEFQKDITYLHERQLIKPMESSTGSGATVWHLTRAAQAYVTIGPKES